MGGRTSNGISTTTSWLDELNTPTVLECWVPGFRHPDKVVRGPGRVIEAYWTLRTPKEYRVFFDCLERVSRNNRGRPFLMPIRTPREILAKVKHYPYRAYSNARLPFVNFPLYATLEFEWIA